MIQADDMSVTDTREAGFKSEAGTAADLDNPIPRLDIQQIDRPPVAFAIGLSIGHDPAGDPSEISMRIPELGNDGFAQTHDATSL
jgi:hypothetical protein